MSLLGLSLLPLSVALSSPFQSLSNTAEASPRPSICRPAASAFESELWTRVASDRHRRFCGLLAQGYAKLQRAPAEAVAVAREASSLLPQQVEARVLLGRGLLRLGDVRGAEQALGEAVRAPGRPLGDLEALRELGVVLVETKQLGRAADVYRVLVPRIDFVQDRRLARIVHLEAAAALMASSEAGATQAGFTLSQARQAAPVPGLQDLTLALVALALDREGKGDHAGVLDQRSSASSLERFLNSSDRARIKETLTLDEGFRIPEETLRISGPWLADGELHAAIGLAASRRDPLLAVAHFSAFLQARGAEGPFAAWAKQRLARLGRPVGVD